MAMFRLMDLVDSLKSGRTGEGARIRVDQANASFYAGREFRMFQRLNIPTGESLVIKANLPVDVLLQGLSVSLVDGWVDVETVVGGTEGGTFATPVPTFAANTMSDQPSPVYVRQTVLTSCGTHTGGTELDVLMARASGATAQAANVGASTDDARGVVAGTYYFRIVNRGNGAAVGVIRARWEERPAGTYGTITY